MLLYVILGLVGLLLARCAHALRSPIDRILTWGLLAVASALVLAPFAWLVCSAFKAPAALMSSTFLPPLAQWSTDTLNLGNFATLVAPQQTANGPVTFWLYVANSLFLATFCTVLTLITSALGGYALAKYRFAGSKALMLFMLGSMMIPGMILLAPLYRLSHGLGMLDTWWALILPGACGAFGVFLFRQAFSQLPDEIMEAARIDGASEWRIWWEIMVPLVRPMSGAYCLITFLGNWNNFLGPQVFLTSPDKMTLPVVLAQYVGQYSSQYGVFLAGTLLAIIPPAILFFALQREFIAGLSAGAVKG